MITFKQYLNEMNDPNGNYVSIESESLKSFFNKMERPMTGTPPPKDDYHCTLMFSKNTSIDTDLVLEELKKFSDKHVAIITKVDCFDSTPKDGERDSAKSCVVLKLDCPALTDIFNHLQSIGLRHSYPEFLPHVTLLYNVDIEEAHYFRDKLNKMNLGWINLSKFTSTVINNSYI